MSFRRVRFSLPLITVAFGIASVAVIAWAIRWPYDRRALATAATATPGRGDRPAEASALPLSKFEPIWKLDLRRPLADTLAPAPATTPAVAAARTPPPGMKLAGTIIEPERSLALLVGASGKVELKSIGDRFAGAEVLQIDPGAVTLQHNGQPLILRIGKEPKR